MTRLAVRLMFLSLVALVALVVLNTGCSSWTSAHTSAVGKCAANCVLGCWTEFQKACNATAERGDPLPKTCEVLKR